MPWLNIYCLLELNMLWLKETRGYGDQSLTSQEEFSFSLSLSLSHIDYWNSYAVAKTLWLKVTQVIPINNIYKGNARLQ